MPVIKTPSRDINFYQCSRELEGVMVSGLGSSVKMHTIILHRLYVRGADFMVSLVECIYVVSPGDTIYKSSGSNVPTDSLVSRMPLCSEPPSLKRQRKLSPLQWKP